MSSSAKLPPLILFLFLSLLYSSIAPSVCQFVLTLCPLLKSRLSQNVLNGRFQQVGVSWRASGSWQQKEETERNKAERTETRIFTSHSNLMRCRRMMWPFWTADVVAGVLVSFGNVHKLFNAAPCVLPQFAVWLLLLYCSIYNTCLLGQPAHTFSSHSKIWECCNQQLGFHYSF